MKKKPLSSQFLADPSLSLGAKGLYAYLNSKDEPVTGSTEEISCENSDTPEKINGYIEELKKKEVLEVKPEKEDGVFLYVIVKKPLSKVTETDRQNTKRIFAFWNAQGVYTHRVLSPQAQHSIERALGTYTVEEIMKSIENYSSVQKSKVTYWDHRWTLDEFMKRPMAMPVFIEKSELDYLDRSKIKGTQFERDLIQREQNEQKRLKAIADREQNEKVEKERVESEKQVQILARYWVSLSQETKDKIQEEARTICEPRLTLKDNFPGLYETYLKQATKQVLSNHMQEHGNH